MDVDLPQRISLLLQRSLDLLFPPRCVGCQRHGSLLCPACWQTMQPGTIPRCQHCGGRLLDSATICDFCRNKRLHLHGLHSVASYEGTLRLAIHALKYDGQLRLALPLGQLLAEAFRLYNMQTEGIIPLPLHPGRQQRRGYNQATLLARVCANHLKVPCLEDMVIRQWDTQAQVGLTFQQRQQNIAGAFALNPGALPRLKGYRSLLLLDDVSTTGATLEACATPLYTAGVPHVEGLVLARPDTMTQDGSKGML